MGCIFPLSDLAASGSATVGGAELPSPLLLPLAPEDGDCGAIFWLGPELLSVAAPDFAEGVVEWVNNCADVGDEAKNAAPARL